MEKQDALKSNIEGKWIARLKGNRTGNIRTGEYVPVRLKNGKMSHGGNQSWWRPLLKEQDLKDQRVRTRYQHCKKDEYFRLSNLGCGVIAMTNLELYLAKRNCSKPEIESKLQEISQESYEKEAIGKWERTYHIGKSYLNYLSGLYPWKMERGLRKFLKNNAFTRTKVKWAPFFPGSDQRQSKLVINSIIDMLQNDYPVVIAYYSKKKDLVLYLELERAINAQEVKGKDERIKSHYMTVIGVFETADGDRILEIESWGMIYYARYDEFARKLNFFSNMLRIY